MQKKKKNQTHQKPKQQKPAIIFIGIQVFCEEITLQYRRSSNRDKLQKGRFSLDNRKKLS